MHFEADRSHLPNFSSHSNVFPELAHHHRLQHPQVLRHHRRLRKQLRSSEVSFPKPKRTFYRKSVPRVSQLAQDPRFLSRCESSFTGQLSPHRLSQFADNKGKSFILNFAAGLRCEHTAKSVNHVAIVSVDYVP